MTKKVKSQTLSPQAQGRSATLNWRRRHSTRWVRRQSLPGDATKRQRGSLSRSVSWVASQSSSKNCPRASFTRWTRRTKRLSSLKWRAKVRRGCHHTVHWVTCTLLLATTPTSLNSSSLARWTSSGSWRSTRNSTKRQWLLGSNLSNYIKGNYNKFLVIWNICNMGSRSSSSSTSSSSCPSSSKQSPVKSLMTRCLFKWLISFLLSYLGSTCRHCSKRTTLLRSRATSVSKPARPSKW